jgi:hypothetical protein
MVEVNWADFKDAADWFIPLSALPAVPEECEAVAERNYRRGYYDAWMYAMGRLEEYLPEKINDQLWNYLRERLLPWRRAGYHADPKQPYLPPTFRPSGRPTKERGARESQLGGVYIMQIEGESPVKIGHGIDPIARKKALQTGNPRPLIILRVIPSANAYRLEQALHKRYEAFCIRKEWFDLPPDVLNALLREGFNDF